MSLDFSLEKVVPTDVFSANITHNLGRMATKAGVYDELWHPENIGGVQPKKAADIIEALEDGLFRLKAMPDHFRKYNAANGWGLYEHFVSFVEQVLAGCREHPDAIVRTST